MKRKLLAISVFYMLGIFMSPVIDINSSIFILFVSVLMLITGRIFLKKQTFYISLVLIMGLGNFQYHLYRDLQISKVSPYYQSERVVSGKVVSIPKNEEGKQKFYINTQTIGRERVRTKIYITYSGKEEIKYGDKIKGNCYIFIPKTYENEGVFNYLEHNFQKGVFAFGSIRNVTLTKRDLKFYNPFDLGNFLAEKVSEISEKFFDGGVLAVFKGLFIGDKSLMDSSLKEMFSKSGLSHIVAVSGSHVNAFLSVIMVMFFFLAPKGRVSRAIYIAFVFVFVIMTGAEPSAVRSGIMCILMQLSYILKREVDNLTNLSFACAIMLLINPLSAFDTGFLLSASATLGIIIFAIPLKEKLKFIKSPILGELIAVTLSAQFFTMPIIINNFNYINFLSIIANVLVVPLLPMFIFGAILLFAVSFIEPVAKVIALFLEGIIYFILYVAKFTSQTKIFSAQVGDMDLVFIVSYILFIVLLGLYLYNQRKEIKKFAFIMFSVSVIINGGFYILDSNKLRIDFINVGQGDACLVRTPKNYSFLIDGGGLNNYDVSSYILEPFLDSKGVFMLDGAVLSHYHDDHAQGILGLVKAGRVKNLILPDCDNESEMKAELIKYAKIAGTKVHFISMGESIRTDGGVKFSVLSGIKNSSLDTYSQNELTAVLRLVYNGFSVLFTGDMTAQIEKELMDRNVFIDSDVLKVAHHGSKYSTSKEFLMRVTPAISVISVGDNPYGHPSEEVLERLAEANSKVFRTDINKTISFVVNNRGEVKVKTYRGG